MPKFSERSISKLKTCHPELQRLFYQVIKYYDCTILEGSRGKEKQTEYFEQKKSKLAYPLSKHNREPSEAVDVVPYPIDWKDTVRFYHFAGFVKGTADFLGIPIRWGGDWDGDTMMHDQSFFDLPHFEIKE